MSKKEICLSCVNWPSAINCIGKVVGTDLDTGNVIECADYIKISWFKKLFDWFRPPSYKDFEHGFKFIGLDEFRKTCMKNLRESQNEK